MYEDKYYINPDYDCIQKENELICINCQSGNWIKLNETSADFLRRISDKTLNQIINNISEELALPIEVAKTIYNPIITHLITSELILNRSSATKIVPEVSLQSNVTTYPKKIWIHIIDTCNLACNYCYYGAKQYSGERAVARVDLERLFAFLDSIPQEERERVTISGGEPFLNKELIRIVTHVKDELQFKELVVISNGTVGHELYKDVLPHIDCLQLSMDGTTKEIHELIRGRGSHDMLLKGIKKAHDCGFKEIRLSFTVHSDNLKDLENLPIFAYEKEIASVHINNLTRVGRNMKGDSLTITQEDFEHAYAAFRHNLRNMNFKIHYEREVQQVGMEERRPYITFSNSFDLYSKIAVAGRLLGCGMGVGMISIDADGTIYPCPSLHHKEFAIGSLDTHYEKVKENGMMFSLEYNVENEKTKCYSCKYRYFCGGGCRAEALANGDIYGCYVKCDSFFSDLLRSIKEF